MKNYLHIYILCIAMVFYALPSYSNERAKVVTAAQDELPPFVIDENNGLVVDIIKASLSQEGYSLKINIKPWARALRAVEYGNDDILITAWKNEEREKKFLFSTAFLRNRLKIITLAGMEVDSCDFATLKGKRIGVVRGYEYGEGFKKNENEFYEFSNIGVALQKLRLKHIDLAVEDEIVALSKIKQLKLERKEFKFSLCDIYKNDMHVAISLKNPRSHEIINAFNRGFAKTEMNGTLENIINNWGVRE